MTGLRPWLAGGVVLFALYVLAPFAWMISISFKPTEEIFAKTLALLPREPTLENYRMIFDFIPYPRYFLNSLLVAVVSTTASLVVATFAGYSFSRFRFHGRQALAFLMLATQMFPLVTGIIPLYLVFSRLGLINTLWCLYIVYVAFELPFCVWMLKGFFDAIPIDIEEAAIIDGCSRFQVLMRITGASVAAGLRRHRSVLLHPELE